MAKRNGLQDAKKEMWESRIRELEAELAEALEKTDKLVLEAQRGEKVAVDKLVDLRRELAEARRDGARLDFAERGRLDIYHRSLMPESKQWGITTAHPHPAHRKHFAKRTLRAAIDAAMKEAK